MFRVKKIGTGLGQAVKQKYSGFQLPKRLKGGIIEKWG